LEQFERLIAKIEVEITGRLMLINQIEEDAARRRANRKSLQRGDVQEYFWRGWANGVVRVRSSSQNASIRSLDSFKFGMQKEISYGQFWRDDERSHDDETALQNSRVSQETAYTEDTMSKSRAQEHLRIQHLCRTFVGFRVILSNPQYGFYFAL
jgi:hypothetical protein